MDKGNYFSGRVGLLSKSAEAQLKRAFESPIEERNGLWTHYLKPNLVDVNRGTYVPLLPRMAYSGYRQEHIESLILNGAGDEEILASSPLFCMPLREAAFGREYGDNGKPAWEKPSSRLVNAGFWVFTMEVDAEGLVELEEQLSWCRSRGKKPADSPIGKVDRALKRFKDYRGVTAVYSGNKSIHFHFIFDTRHLCPDMAEGRNRSGGWLGDLPDLCLKDLYKCCWGEVAKSFIDGLGTRLMVDGRLANIFQQRRTPWGHRVVEDGHILKLKPGTIVRQVVLLDLVRLRAPKGSTEWLLHPEKATPARGIVADAPRRSYGHPIEQDTADDVLLELAELLRVEWDAEYPQPVAILNEGGENVVHFKNHIGDKNPSTIIRGPYRALLICGANAPPGPFCMPHGWTLDEVLDDIRGIEPTGKNNSKCETYRPFWERRFADQATSKNSARKALGRSTNLVTGAGSFAWIKSVEGIGKTRALIHSAAYRRYDQFLGRYWGSGSTGKSDEPVLEPGFLAFACRSYAQAEEKCQEFNSIHNEEGRFFGRVLPSFSKVYRDACRQIGATAKSRADAAKSGYSSMIDAVQGEQPDVYSEMCRRRADLWTNPFDPKKPFPGPLRIVWFTVHSLIQSWGRRSKSRAWLHLNFDEIKGNPKELAACHDDLWIAEVVYDEVGVDDLVDIVEASVVRWCQSVERGQKKSWGDLTLQEQHAAFANAKHPKPRIGSKELGFDEFRRIIGIGFVPSDLRSVNTSLVPFGHDQDCNGIYFRQNDKKFFLKPRRWWQTLGAKVTILTTEELPTRMAESLRWPAGSSGENELRQSRFRVYRFDASENYISEFVDLHLDTRAAKDQQEQDKISALINEIEEKFPAAMVITNNAGASESTISHVSAKGSNDLLDRDLFTVLQYLNPSQYAQLCLLASEFEILKSVQLHYQDELFQSIGRNRGMRREQVDPKSHTAIMSPRLYKELGMGAFTAGCRYELVRRKGDLKPIMRKVRLPQEQSSFG